MFDQWVKTALACAALAAAACVQASPGPPPPGAARPAAQRPGQAIRHVKPRLDRSGRTRIGKASFYARKFDGRKMADGTRMDPHDDTAASKTLPLGTTAQVTNLETGQSAIVTIRDRGPHVPGRIVDLTPATARKVGLDRREGASRVAVTPIAVPPAGDRLKSPRSPSEAAASRPRAASTAAQR